MNKNLEIWKTIKGYEDYQVSNYGRKKEMKKFLNLYYQEMVIYIYFYIQKVSLSNF